MTELTVALDAGETTALHYPAPAAAGDLLVLAHGAGAGQRHPFMVKMASGLAARGIDAVTFDFPYMHQHRRTPDKTAVLERCFEAVLATIAGSAPLASRRLFIGGKSMGGRIASHLGARAPARLAGIVALGYPLHPPARPQQWRIDHFPSITVPMLIVQGERDTFGTPAEMEQALTGMRAPATLHAVKGGDHSFAVRGTPPQEVYERVLHVIAAWMAALPAPARG